jgi:hypothetical protein
MAWHAVLPCPCLRHPPIAPLLVVQSQEPSIAAPPSSHYPLSPRPHRPAPVHMPLPPTSSPRALPSATAPTRCASCPHPRQPPRASMPTPTPVPAMPTVTAPPPPDVLCGLQMRVRGSLSVEGEERRVSGGPGARARRHDRCRSTAARARSPTAGAASSATARVRETGPWRHWPQAPALAAARHQALARAASARMQPSASDTVAARCPTGPPARAGAARARHINL